ncbi:hypothetical protein LCGC14_1891570 [marine sediment metagenome]|uniref:Uncharacterized protein n=1 Tax=marine sediment metagenome TaxID=412755 RepID=A0A0F9IXI9_9ZZZZ
MSRKTKSIRGRRPLTFVFRDMQERLIWEGESARECEAELDRLRPHYLQYCHLLEVEQACVDSIRGIYALIGSHIDWDTLPPNVQQVLCHVLSTPQKQVYNDKSQRMEVVK